uniref:Uncharacterized protein MANES_12G074000 n=1 Tax=Rhizophora mucronata TaxID=61149 RepID=A0A2P2L7R0_RHIMU
MALDCIFHAPYRLGCDVFHLNWWGESGLRPFNRVSSLGTTRRGLVLFRAELRRPIDQRHRVISSVSGISQKDFNSFPRPLSVADFSAAPEDGEKVRISFKGLPGSYSEDAALKAYPKCETVPCDDFEDAFKAVELWLADKAVLPIESSSGGSIHRNYDLLLRHRLHIVGEVQLSINLCLLALPGVRAEQLTRVLSHSQVLDLSDTFLSKLGVTRENVVDTVVGVKVIQRSLFSTSIYYTA